MAVKEYVSFDGKKLFKVNVHLRSSSDPSVRIQKQKEGMKTASEAKKVELQLIREAEREIARRESTGITWEQLLSAYDNAMKSKGTNGEAPLHDDSRTDYMGTLRKWTHAWFRKPAAEISTLDVKQVLVEMKLAGRMPAYLQKVKCVINSVFTFGIENRLIRGLDRSPAYGINLGRKVEPVPDILTANQISRLLTLAKQYQADWYPVWATAVYTGLRNGELFSLLWGDVDWENRIIHVTKTFNSRKKIVKETKSGYWRDVPISSELELILKELFLKTGDQPHVLPRLDNWRRGGQARELRKFCLQVGLPSIRFHALRACFATQLLRCAVAPITVMKMCGWKDIKTMQHYVRLSGLEITGATEVLKFQSPNEVVEMAAEMFGPKDKLSELCG